MQIRRPCNPPSENPGYGPDEYAGIDRSLTLQATPFADKTVRLIVRSEERKAVGGNDSFALLAHVTSQRALCAWRLCVDIRREIGHAKQVISEGKWPG